MSILTDLRAALEGKREAAALVETRRLQSSRSCSPAFVNRRESLLAHYRLHALLTDDTIRALLDVAEAGAGVITYIEKTVAEFERGYDSAFHTDTLGTTDWARTSMSFDMWEFIRLRKAIDSLVKEATDE